MYSNNKKMARKSSRDAKENYFGVQAMNNKFAMLDDSLENHPEVDRYSLNYFYDIDQSCVDQLKEFLHQKPGKINFMAFQGSPPDGWIHR